MLGKARIDSFDDSSEEAELCSQLYPNAVRHVLEDGAWTFATGRGIIGTSEASDVFDLPYRYNLPGDPEIVRILSVDDGTGTYAAKWLREGDKILADFDGSLYYKAVQYVEDSQQFSAQFCRALALLLASDLAIPLSGNVKISDELEGKYRAALKRAEATDSQQGSGEVVKARSRIQR
jgi:hypothetical protein